MVFCVFVVVWGSREAPHSHKAAQAHRVGGNWCKPTWCWYWRLQSLLTAAICKCLVTSLCLLTVWVSFGALRSYSCSLKKQTGGQRENTRCGAKLTQQQHLIANWVVSPEILSVWSAGSALHMDLHNLLRSDRPKCCQLANIQLSCDRHRGCSPQGSPANCGQLPPTRC